MRARQIQSIHRQRGVATLLTALLVLFVITLITFYAAQSTVTETNVSASQYRTDQSYAAAVAALDYAEARYTADGLDGINNSTGNAGSDGLVDYTSSSRKSLSLTTALSSQTLPAEIFYCNPDDIAQDVDPSDSVVTLATSAQIMANLAKYCPPRTKPNQMTGNVDGPYANQVAIVAIGYSDDRAAQRVIVRSAAALPVLAEGPSSPLSSHGAVNITGSIKVYNRYKNYTVWSGYDLNISAAAAQTFISSKGFDWGQWGDVNDPATSDANKFAEYTARTTDDVSNTYTVQATNSQKGNNFDIIDNDANLRNLTSDQFWNSFFSDNKDGIQEQAEDAGQYFDLADGTPNLAGLSGLVWVDVPTGSTYSINTGTFGTLPTVNDLSGKPIILVVNGDLSTTGGTFFGVLYITGNWHTAGNVMVRGAAVTEGIATAGNGNNRIIYDPKAFEGGGESVSGAVVGSWRDW